MTIRQREATEAFPDAMLTVREVAGRLRVSVGCVYALISRGKLPCHRIGVGRGTIRVHGDDLSTYLLDCKTEHAPSSARELRTSERGRRFIHLDADRLRAAWRKQGVRVDQPSVDSAQSSE